MSIIQGSAHTSAGAGGYQIERSLRFNSADSAYLNRTFGTPTAGTKWTWSCWIKRSALYATKNTQTLFGTQGSGAQGAITFSSSSDYIEFKYSGYFRRSGPVSLRDLSAWYHIVVAIDTTDGTEANRAKLYVNGVQQTWTTSTSITQNDTTQINQNVAHNIGSNSGASANEYSNIYLTEVNFIDGQALTPSSFGETDTNTGVWKPKAYTGSYGTNGFYLPFKTASQWSGYFDGSGDYLSFNGSTGTTLSGDFTVESWVYLPSVSSTAPIMCIGDSFSSPGILFYVNSSSKIAIARANTVAFTGSTSLVANTWNHVAFVRSGSTITGYLNGVSQGTFTNSSTFSGTTTVIGREVYNSGVGAQLTGYISNLRIVNGTAVYTGTFTPPTSQLTAITNTSLLTCQSSTFVDNSTNAFTITTNGDARTQQFSPFTLDVTDDHSGQGNHWIPNNLDLRTTGVGADILVDSPTAYGTDTGAGGEVRGNYCTLNPLGNPVLSGMTFSNGNLTVTTSSARQHIIGTMALPTTGKWYWECNKGNSLTGYQAAGIALINTAITSSPSYNYPYNVWGYNDLGYKIVNGVQTTGYTTSASTSDVWGFAFDADAGTLACYLNNTLLFTISSLTSQYIPYLGTETGCTPSINFGQRPFAYTAPSGFKALCTQNLPTPTIGATSTTQANDYFDILLYNGNNSASTRSITGLEFQPDFIWIKNRNGANSHRLTDAVRGSGISLLSNSTSADVVSTTYAPSAFISGGFQTTTSDNSINGLTTDTYVAWNWKANGAGVTNTAGSITSTVSANTTSGFSIVTYTGTGANATVGHGLGVAPKMVIVKGRSEAGYNWAVWHTAFGTATNSDYILLDNTGGKGAFGAVAFWNSTVPDSTKFSIGTYVGVNNSTKTYVAYCFAEVAGYSAFGSYTGNGSTDGPFVFCGFRPRYILWKVSSGTTGHWEVVDTARETYNQSDQVLFASSSGAESAASSSYYMDILSNGFKIRNTDTSQNGNTYTYIYAAFAESPFKYALAR